MLLVKVTVVFQNELPATVNGETRSVYRQYAWCVGDDIGPKQKAIKEFGPEVVFWDNQDDSGQGKLYIDSLFADGDEFEYIRANIIGLPFVAGKKSALWAASLATSSSTTYGSNMPRPETDLFRLGDYNDARYWKHCLAGGCSSKCPPRLLFCKEHWFKIPVDVRDRVSTGSNTKFIMFKEGKPKKKWLLALSEAINSLKGPNG